LKSTTPTTPLKCENDNYSNAYAGNSGCWSGLRELYDPLLRRPTMATKFQELKFF